MAFPRTLPIDFLRASGLRTKQHKKKFSVTELLIANEMHAKALIRPGE